MHAVKSVLRPQDIFEYKIGASGWALGGKGEMGP